MSRKTNHTAIIDMYHFCLHCPFDQRCAILTILSHGPSWVKIIVPYIFNNRHSLEQTVNSDVLVLLKKVSKVPRYFYCGQKDGVSIKLTFTLEAKRRCQLPTASATTTGNKDKSNQLTISGVICQFQDACGVCQFGQPARLWSRHMG